MEAESLPVNDSDDSSGGGTSSVWPAGGVPPMTASMLCICCVIEARK